jgi:hypothetical protein
MNDHRQLTLEYARDSFRSKPTYKSASWYLQVLMRYRHSSQIDDQEYVEGMDEIKEWMRRRR